jgi:hypothetical protein
MFCTICSGTGFTKDGLCPKCYGKKERVQIRYWIKDLSSKTGYKDKHKVSRHDMHEVIDMTLSAGLNVMLQNTSKDLILWIDDERFKQR